MADDELDGGAGATTLADVGGAADVSLREAIVLASNGAGAQEIRFDPAVFPVGSAPSIMVGAGPAGGSPLPSVSGGNICIDGAGAEVVIAGSFSLPTFNEDGLRFTSANNLLANVAVVSFPDDGIVVSGSGAMGNVVRDCTVGIAGGMILGNGDEGIEVQNGASNNTIGPGNVVAGNADDGIYIVDAGTIGNVVLNNDVGIDTSVSLAAPNGAAGIVVASGAANTVVGPGNVVGANNSHGVYVVDSGAGTVVVGNFIGVTPGMGPAGNGNDGIQVTDSAFVTIGGPAPADANVIGFNAGDGIEVFGAGSHDIEILGNLIGSDAVLMTAFPNVDDGVDLEEAFAVVVGPGNVIGFNFDDGVTVETAFTDAVTITANAISSNGSAGIHLDPGANGGILPPVITAANMSMVSGTAMVADGSLVDVYSDSADEARCIVALGVPVTAGAWTYSGPVSACAGSLTATVTDLAGSTSALSAPVAAP